jgi:hypothetical protein
MQAVQPRRASKPGAVQVNAPAAVITNPANIGAAPNTIADKNVTTLALEVHRSCLVAGVLSA